MKDENEEDQEDHDFGSHQMEWAMKKEFKLAMLEKKEKILQAKLDFLGKIKGMVNRMPADKK
jgi:hypothetical protein